MGHLIYKRDPSFIYEDIYVSFGTTSTPYVDAGHSQNKAQPLSESGIR